MPDYLDDLESKPWMALAWKWFDRHPGASEYL